MNQSLDLEEESNKWTEIISSKTGLFDIRLDSVWKYRDLLWLFVRRDFIAQYKQTILGPLWNVIQPVFTTIMFLLVFGKIANIPTDGVHPILFYMSGITIWNYFSSCILSTSNTFIANAGIFGKVYFPRLILPLSIILSSIVRFSIQFGLVLIVIIWYDFHGSPTPITIDWIFILVLIIMVALMGLGLGIIISSLTTKYRDLMILLNFAIQLAMYATPIAYPLSYLKGKNYRHIIEWNPLTPIVEAFRFCLFGKGTFTISSLIYCFICMSIFLFSGLLIFNKVEKTFMDTV